MDLKCSICGEQISETDPGVEKTDVSFTLNYECECGAQTDVNFDVSDVEVTDKDGNSTNPDIHDILN